MTDNSGSFAVLDHDDAIDEHLDRHRRPLTLLVLLLVVLALTTSLWRGWIPMPSLPAMSSLTEKADKPGLIERSITKARNAQVTSDAHQVSVVVVSALTEPGATVKSVFSTRPPADVTARVRYLGFDPTKTNHVYLLALRGDDYVVCVGRPDQGPSATYRSRANKVSTSTEACPAR